MGQLWAYTVVSSRPSAKSQYGHILLCHQGHQQRVSMGQCPYGGTDPLGMFPLFLKSTAHVLAPRLSVVFRRLLRLGSFPACWR